MATRKKSKKQKNNKQSKKKILKEEEKPVKKAIKTKDIIIAQQRKQRSIASFAGGNVQKHTEENYTQNFATYNDIYGSDTLDYDLIDGLYHSTILNRILRKISSDAVPDMFQVQVVDIEGNRIPEIELECFKYTAALKRKHIRALYLTQLKYGTAFLYIGNKEEEVLTNIFLLHPKDLEPEVGDDGEIENWIWSGGDIDVDIPPEDLVVLPYDADIGEVFGMSALGPIVQTLHLLLNTELNIAEIVDKFAVPILQWLVEVGEDEELQEDELEGIVNSLQKQLEYSNDVVTTDKIRTETIGFAQNQYDMTTTLAALKESLGILTFPFSLIGGKANNLSAIKTQASQYMNDLKDMQLEVGDGLVEQLYEPFIQNTLGKALGDDYANIYLVFPTLTTEANGDAATWIFPAIKHGLITRDEARAQLSFRGKALPIEEIEFPDPTLREYQEQTLDNASNGVNIDNDGTDVKTPRNRSGKGDEESKKTDRQNEV